MDAVKFAAISAALGLALALAEWCVAAWKARRP